MITKDHILCDADSKLVIDYGVSVASPTIARCYCRFSPNQEDRIEDLRVDSAYLGEEINAVGSIALSGHPPTT